WVTLPPVGADPAVWTWNRAYLLLGAARLARYRMQFADTWTYFTGGGYPLLFVRQQVPETPAGSTWLHALTMSLPAAADKLPGSRPARVTGRG
ncbi:MAG TPA: hypothetical protein VG253_13320, partial [Streptosporangiaceae bacterium]|nr:hypothetical protein [Streptosporangiaceae bacterium]